MRLRSLRDVAKETTGELVKDDVLTLGAALAFYTAPGMSPLLVLALWLATLVGEDVRQQLLAQIPSVVGPKGGSAVRAIVASARARPAVGNTAGLVSLATLLFSVSGVFGELQSDLNTLRDVVPKRGSTGTWSWSDRPLGDHAPSRALEPRLGIRRGGLADRAPRLVYYASLVVFAGVE